MHGNVLAVIAFLKVVMSVSRSIGSNVSQLVYYNDFHKLLYFGEIYNGKIVL